MKQIQNYLKKKLLPLSRAVKKFPVSKLIGSSGSFETFAEMSGYRFHNKNMIRNVNSFKFDLKEFSELYQLILSSTVADRMKMKGLIRMRIDMIVIASILIESVLNEIEIKKMYLSKYALKEGALLDAVSRLAN